MEYSSFQQFKPTTSGPITVFWYAGASSTAKQKYEIRQRDDSSVLFGDSGANHAKAGSRVWIEVANDAFAAESPLVTLTFHSGTDHNGTEIATATVQKQAKPFTPISGSADADATADPGPLRGGGPQQRCRRRSAVQRLCLEDIGDMRARKIWIGVSSNIDLSNIDLGIALSRRRTESGEILGKQGNR